MRTLFRNYKMQLANKYDWKNNPCTDLAKWMQAYGEMPQPEWVHLLFHTLDVIPMNWYIEIELCNGIGKWDILNEGFMMTFSFEDGLTVLIKCSKR